jgi:hypothetical protein
MAIVTFLFVLAKRYNLIFIQLDDFVRVLSTYESKHVSGSMFIPGMIADDFLAMGAVLGLSVAVGLGVIARNRFKQEPLSLAGIASCTLFTALNFAKLGLVLDGANLTYQVANNTLFS